jgi:hypothetical protein
VRKSRATALACATSPLTTGDDMANSRTTTDHEEIRRWAEERGGVPSTVIRTEQSGEPGILRIDFPGFSGEDTLEEISWDDFFRKFEESNLAFLFEEDSSSRFNKLVSRHSAKKKQQREGSGSSRTRGRSRTSTRSTAAKSRSAKGSRASGSTRKRRTRAASSSRSSRSSRSGRSRSVSARSGSSSGRGKRTTAARGKKTTARATSGKRKAQSARSSRSSRRAA